MLTKRERAFQLVKKYTDEERKVIGIVCGGDGTIMWVVSELNKYKIEELIGIKFEDAERYGKIYR